MPTFTPPHVEEAMGPVTGLFRYYKLRRGICVLVDGTTVTESRFPFQGDLESYDFVYLGGHTHIISTAEATTLTNAGYGAYIS